jgi:hypothetical protein
MSTTASSIIEIYEMTPTRNTMVKEDRQSLPPFQLSTAIVYADLKPIPSLPGRKKVYNNVQPRVDSRREKQVPRGKKVVKSNHDILDSKKVQTEKKGKGDKPRFKLSTKIDYCNCILPLPGRPKVFRNVKPRVDCKRMMKRIPSDKHDVNNDEVTINLLTEKPTLAVCLAFDEAIKLSQISLLKEKRKEAFEVFEWTLTPECKMRINREFPFRFIPTTVMLDFSYFPTQYYRTAEVLGRGGFGVVHKGYRRIDNRPVAIKTIQAGDSTLAYDVSGTLYPTESCFLDQLRGCAGVIQLLDTFYDKYTDDFFIVMEMVEDCKTLEEYISNNGPLEESEIRQLFTKVVEAVDQCFQRGVDHRDIKEENILVSGPQNIIKLIDFGLSSVVALSPYDDPAGTPLYISPEMKEAIIDKTKMYDGMPAAVYSLGVVLYDMIFTTVAWGYPSEDAINDTPASTELLTLLNSMLASDPEKRPTIKKVLERLTEMTNVLN